jgi:signal transduction histidine kinase
MTEVFVVLRWFLFALGVAGVAVLGPILVRWVRQQVAPPQQVADLPTKEADNLRRRLTQLQERLERLRSVLRLSAELNADLEYANVLNLTLNLASVAVATTGVEDIHLVGALLLLDDHHLHLAASRGLTKLDQEIQLPAKEGAIARAIDTAECVRCSDPRMDEELKRLVGFIKCGSAVVIPLVFSYEVYGAMVFGHQEAYFFDNARMELLEAIAQQAAIALQNAKLYADLLQEKERITQVQEKARKRLARELHDGPAQSVGAITMRVNFVRRLMQREPREAADELYKIEELARRTSKEIRQMLFTLRPLILESKGLLPALEHLVNSERETHGQNVILEASKEAALGLEVSKQNIIFYVAEESIANARKHAKAEHIWVRIRRRADIFQLEVEDDGVGFEMQALQKEYDRRSSLGMINLREQAEMVNGLLKIDTAPGKGTRVRLTVPLTVEAVDRIKRLGFAA